MRPLRAAMITGIMIALLALSAAPGYAATIYDDASCVSYWKLDDGNGSTADDYKNVNDGTLNQTDHWTSSGKVGGAYDFDGTDDYVLISQTFDFISAGSASVWFKPSSIDVGEDGIVVASSPSDINRWQIQLKANMVKSGYWDGDAYNKVSGLIANTGWHHAVFTHDGSVARLYLDGVSQTGTVDPESSGMIRTTIGIQANLLSRPFDGMIDEVAIWNTTLSPDDVETIYNMGLIGGGAINELGFDQVTYDTEALGELADLYAAADTELSVAIDGITWRYVANLPGGPYTPGYAFYDSGANKYYIEMANPGLEGDPAVPEPATVVGMLAAMAVIGFRRMKKGR